MRYWFLFNLSRWSILSWLVFFLLYYFLILLNHISLFSFIKFSRWIGSVIFIKLFICYFRRNFLFLIERYIWLSFDFWNILFFLYFWINTVINIFFVLINLFVLIMLTFYRYLFFIILSLWFFLFFIWFLSILLIFFSFIVFLHCLGWYFILIFIIF